VIGNLGVWGDTGIIRIGEPGTHTTTYLAGDVYGVSFNPTSDRNAKEDVEAVEPGTVLEKVAALPISTWRFRQQADTRHIGPMAQDFYAAFGVGLTTSTSHRGCRRRRSRRIQGLYHKLTFWRYCKPGPVTNGLTPRPSTARLLVRR